MSNHCTGTSMEITSAEYIPVRWLKLKAVCSWVWITKSSYNCFL